jgi:hypothetical protein
LGLYGGFSADQFAPVKFYNSGGAALLRGISAEMAIFLRGTGVLLREVTNI